MNQKLMYSKIRCLNAKMFCCKSKNSTGILSLTEGYPCLSAVCATEVSNCRVNNVSKTGPECI